MCAFGTFDFLHPGHCTYLRFAQGQGDELIVVVTPDSVVFRLKGKKSVLAHNDRMMVVRELKMVSDVILGDADDSWSVLLSLKPAVICFGYDQEKARQSLEASQIYTHIGSPPIIFAPAYHSDTYHSSAITLDPKPCISYA